MFDRRLKLILLVLFVFTGLLVLRAAHLQLLGRETWEKRAEELSQRPQTVETVRGRLLDVRGRTVAEDAPCIDACVDYRAVVRPADEKWVLERARERLRRARDPAWAAARGAARKQMLDAEADRVRADVDRLWDVLADVSRLPGETAKEAADRIEEARQAIVSRVEMRRRYLWFRNYQLAVRKHDERAEERSAWERWLLSGSGSEQLRIDNFALTVAEQEAAHVVLPAVDDATVNVLGTHLEKLPGLVLRPGTHRVYPYADAAAHVLGYVRRVNADDLKNDPNRQPEGDELRKYYPHDLIGGTGAEALAEQTLRGARGQINRRAGSDEVVSTVPAKSGADARLSIDIELQKEVQNLFADVAVRGPDGKLLYNSVHYGAAVVIDVPTGQVRALASYPSFDLNKLDERYAQLSTDEINRPMLNRATMFALEPGSTIKPVAGLSAITAGVAGVHEGIECSGYLTLGKTRYPNGRCWTASRFANDVRPEVRAAVPHHQIPIPHRGQHGNFDGFLTYAEALERSCNIYFETAADRLGVESLSDWYLRWGLGRRTGIGIEERPGLLPNTANSLSRRDRKVIGFLAGIGQGRMNATPIQMANVAATIARDGVWRRPSLVSGAAAVDGDVVDLKLSREGLAAAKLGMTNVVASRAGTGGGILHSCPDLKDRVRVAGKTGTAQAAVFNVPLRDPDGKIVRLPDGKVARRFFDPLVVQRVDPTDRNSPYVVTNPDANGDVPGGLPWYRGSGLSGKDLAHAWYIGFAPAEDPQVAFCVFVEYGGSGGLAAAAVGGGVLDKCVEHGYLTLAEKQSVVIRP